MKRLILSRLSFMKLFRIYLNLQGKPPAENALGLIQKYGPQTEDPYLAYILAASYANSGQFDKFYPLFKGIPE